MTRLEGGALLMLPTLQWYILRRMTEIFLLAVFGLTAVLALGGGVMNLIEIGHVSPSQFVRLMVLVLPLVGLLALPVAAIYSAAAVYGRMSADNEFLACRAVGINVYHLFLPPLMLSLLVSICTFYFASFLLPGLVRNLDNFADEDLRQFVIQRLASPKRLRFAGSPVRIYADRAAPIRDDPGGVLLTGVVFLEASDQSYSRLGTAESVTLRFSTVETGDAAVSGKFVNATLVDNRRGEWRDVADQAFGPETLPRLIRSKVKWLNLSELMDYRRNPQDWPELADLLDAARAAIARDHYYMRVREDYRSDSRITLSDDHSAVTLSAGAVRTDWDPHQLVFTDVRVTENRDGRTRTIEAASATLSVAWYPDSGIKEGILRVTGDVVVTKDGGQARGEGRERRSGLVVRTPFANETEPISDSLLLDPNVDISWGRVGGDLRARAIHEARKLVRRVTAELHSRLALSISVFPLVLLAAAMGMLLRNSHALVAFGISFVPALFVIVMNIMGRQLAQNEGTVLPGLCVVWGSVLVVALLDAWALVWGIRR